MIYHVSKNGSDKNCGTENEAFLTIQKAAEIAQAGDRIIIHEGVYREYVDPKRGGKADNCRITYEAATGEHVEIRGSEIVKGWNRWNENVWRVEIDNTIFENDNPFTKAIEGDWLIAPNDKPVHTGEVYINGKACYEADSLDAVLHPVQLKASPFETWNNREEKIPDQSQMLFRWYFECNEKTTILYVNFQGYDPNVEEVEINVRPFCFYPSSIGIDYITVRGLEIANAATPWVPPTADQPGMIGPHWSKGWIIEDNIIHDAKCSAISLGKEKTTGDNEHFKRHTKPGYQYQMESVFKARHIGWGKERIGSHIVRNNVIYNCGQNGIVGHLGCIYSEIYGNEIYNIGTKHEFYGHEIGGIKLHAAIDVKIHNNYIHDCSLGTWLDWQAQGVRVNNNLYCQNNRDFMIEVTHGPYLVDNNIFASPFSLVNAAQGGAYVHNLICGFMSRYPVLNRATPYHLPHSTEIMGTALVYGGDDRWYQNIFVGGTESEQYGTADYNGSTTSMEEYTQKEMALGSGDVEQFEQIKQPVYIDRNVYFGKAVPFEREEHYLKKDSLYWDISDTEEGVFLDFELPETFCEFQTMQITTECLGITRISEAPFDCTDGGKLVIDTDMLGTDRSKNPLPGPIEKAHYGKNKIKLWSR